MGEDIKIDFKVFLIIVRSGNTNLSNLKAYFQKISAIWG